MSPELQRLLGHSDWTYCSRDGTDQTQKEESPGWGLPAMNNTVQLRGARVGETQVKSSSVLEASRFYSPEADQDRAPPNGAARHVQARGYLGMVVDVHTVVRVDALSTDDLAVAL